MRRKPSGGLIEALTDGREPSLARAITPQITSDEVLAWERTSRERAGRDRAARATAPSAPPPPTESAREELLRLLRARRSLRLAVLLQEVLGPPRSLQP